MCFQLGDSVNLVKVSRFFLLLLLFCGKFDGFSSFVLVLVCTFAGGLPRYSFVLDCSCLGVGGRCA